MKKLVLTFAVVFATITAANAQLFVGGSLGLGINSIGKTENTGGGTTVTVDPVKTLSFNINPRIGYNLNDKMAVGLDLGFGMTNNKYPDGWNGLNTTENKKSTTTIGAGVFFRYYLMEVGQWSVFAEATAGLTLGNGKEEWKTTVGTTTTTTTVDAPKATDITVAVTPGISYKVNEKLQFDAYLGLLQLAFNNHVEKSDMVGGGTNTVTDNYFNFGVNRNGQVGKIGLVYNF